MKLENWEEYFASRQIEVDGTSIFVRTAGSGAPLLLLHGFPQTHLMWREVAPRLAGTFTVVCADLRGYGRSGCPGSTPDHAPYSKRALARDMVLMMQQLGFTRFSIAGHDRGGRVAYRLALDHPERVQSIAVLDVIPTDFAWKRANAEFALGFWPWSLLAQPSPLPEQILSAAAEAIVDHALAEWGSSPDTFPRDIRNAYVQTLSSPEHARGICEEYRAAATIDRVHDAEDRDAHRRIPCPLLVLWSARGPLASWYDADGGPIGVWSEWATRVNGHAINAGHFFPEEAPETTADALAEFFSAATNE